VLPHFSRVVHTRSRRPSGDHRRPATCSGRRTGARSSSSDRSTDHSSSPSPSSRALLLLTPREARARHLVRPGRQREYPPPAGSGSGPNSTQYKSADHACKSLLPNGGVESSGELTQRRASLLAFAACMRKHGIPNFPDPDGQGQFPSSMVQILRNKAQFRAAESACPQHRPRPSVPRGVRAQMRYCSTGTRVESLL
jgi:hypothetical protein